MEESIQSTCLTLAQFVIRLVVSLAFAKVHFTKVPTETCERGGECHLDPKQIQINDLALCCIGRFAATGKFVTLIAIEAAS